MNYIREAEKYLWHYKDLKYSLEQIDREIVRLKWQGAPSLPSAISYSGMPSGNRVQDEMMNIVFQIKKFMYLKERTAVQMEEIDLIMEELEQELGCENYGKVLKLWYVEKLSKEEIAEELSYSSRTSIYNIKDKAIRKFAIRLFGLEALIAV